MKTRTDQAVLSVSKIALVLGVAALSSLTSGCMFLELTGGYYFAGTSAADGQPDPPAASEPGGSSFGVGVSVGTYIDVAQTVRIAPAGGVEYTRLSSDDGGKGSFHVSGYGGRADVTPVAIDDDDEMKLGGSLAVLYGKSTVKYTPNGLSETTARGSGLSLFAGPTVAFFPNKDESVMLSLGAHYMRGSQDAFGRATAVGPQLRITISADVTADDGSESSGGGGDSGDNITVSIELPNSQNIIPNLAQGARSAGCEVGAEESNVFVAKCSEGVIGFLQSDQTLVVSCHRSMSKDQCRSAASRIVEAAPGG